MPEKPERKIRVDPDIARLMQQDQHRQEERTLPQAERKKRIKEREKMRKRNRKVLDLPEHITDRLSQIAEQYGCPESQVAAFLLAHGIQDLDDEHLDLTPYLRPSRSPRYDHNLIYPESEDE